MLSWAKADLAIKGVWAAVVALAFVVVLGLLAVQTVRVEGFKFWPISVEGWKPKAERLQADLDRIDDAQDLAAQKARDARLKQERDNARITQKVDDDARNQLPRALDSTERFIAAGGVWPQGAGRSCGRAGAATEVRSAADPQGAGRSAELDAAADRSSSGLPEGYVIVRADDVRLCTLNTIKAEAGHSLAIELERLGSSE